MNSGRGRPGVLFDLDGTLVDTNYLHTLAWSRALAEVGEWAPMHAIHRLVGMGGDQLVPELIGHENDAAKNARPAQYRKLMGEAKAFPAARDLLAEVHAQGVLVVLASSAPSDELEAMLDVLTAGDAIDEKTTADEVENSKPAPDIFLKAMEKAGVDPRYALAVGDSIWDIQSARAAGIGCVALESGGFSQHELAEEGALQVYRDVKELLDRLFTSALAPLLSK